MLVKLQYPKRFKSSDFFFPKKFIEYRVFFFTEELPLHSDRFALCPRTPKQISKLHKKNLIAHIVGLNALV